MAILRLFDVSQYISAGDLKKNRVVRGYREVAGNAVANEIPVGGIAYLFEEIKKYRAPGVDLVFCIDKTPTIKRMIYNEAFPSGEGYKGNRPKKSESVILQRALVEEMLRAVGFNTIGVPTYEADDVIASLVKYYKDSYEKIYIHSKDSDLFYLVDNNVECVPVGQTGKHVTRLNWERTVISGYIVPYNMLTLNKMLKGDSGDNIPNVPECIIDPVFNAIPESEYYRCGDNDYLRKIVHEVTRSNPRAVAVMELIMPLILKESEVQLFDEQIDESLLGYFMQEIGVSKCNIYAPDRNRVGNDIFMKFINQYGGEMYG